MQTFLRLTQIHKSFHQTVIFNDLNLHFQQGKMTTLLGPSGCGKTTLLRLIAGLDTPDKGQIWLNGQEISQRPPQQRQIGIVFQSYALFPHLTIGENVGFGLKMQGVPKTEMAKRVEESLSLVELEGFSDRLIHQISGGQQQRVALARALILKPQVLLFDEPLSNLDSNLRHTMRLKIRALQQQLGITAIYVTHDQSEAFAVSDEVVVMNHGKIEQQGSAESLYRQPNSPFIAQFMGEASFFLGKKQGNDVKIGQATFSLNSTACHSPDGDYVIGIRPEAVRLVEQGEECQRCEIQQVLSMGDHWDITAQWQGQPLHIKLRPDEFYPHSSTRFVTLKNEGIFLLPPKR